MGGVKNRSTVDNIFILTAIIERNKYLGKNTYITYADAEKCFDRLWLEDGIIELWRCGNNVRDAIMVKKMNEKALITIKTPVGTTEEISVDNTVRQGTVYGPVIGGVSTDRVNTMGKEICTMYGPELIIKAPVFVDDINSAGSCKTANNTINNCCMLETRKKMIFNNETGKTEYTVIRSNTSVECVTATVKRGKINMVKEHKALGVWIDERGTYMINIEKNEEKVPYMTAMVKCWTHSSKMGILAVESKVKLAETVVLPSLLYNIEAFPTISEKEVDRLEKLQMRVMTNLLGLPISTPHMGILLETGMWTMKARVAYKKLMLCNNILQSEESRVTKKIVEEQQKEERKGTWFEEIKGYIKHYEIEGDPSIMLKSSWKKEVK